eukprot:COSAG01_NODE_40953_length_457_cov_2.008380_1_plen_29_part_10
MEGEDMDAFFSQRDVTKKKKKKKKDPFRV